MPFNLFFWERNQAKNIRLNLQLIEKNIKKLVGLKQKKAEALAAIASIKKQISGARTDIREKANQEKHNPLLTTEQDQIIDRLAEEEIQSLNQLSKDLGSYEELLTGSVTEEDVQEIISLFLEEEEQISRREKESEARIKVMEEQTKKARLSRPSTPVPGLRTTDGVRWNDVVKVARELGGSVNKTAGRHPYELTFPNGHRPIPLSSDVSTTALARKIREQLLYSIPEHKIPNTTKLRRALASGDIHQSS